MNEVIKTILARKGTKEYSAAPVEKEKLELLMKCAAAGPSAYNAQKWHFTCISSAELLADLDEKCYRALIPVGICSADSRYYPLHKAPALLVFSADKENRFGKQDCSAALQNAAIAAKSLGLGGRFLDVPNVYFNSDEAAPVRRLCGIPENYETICFLCVGYPADPDEQPTEKRTDLSTYVD